MKIVIDIPEDVYNSIKSNEEIINYITKDGGGSNELQGSLAILNGKILPKGHGRLVDADKFISEHFGEVARLVDDAPTIIEADKESD